MSYDPCGTQHLEGDEIIRRLAVYLGVDKDDLKAGLLALSAELKAFRTLGTKGE